MEELLATIPDETDLMVQTESSQGKTEANERYLHTLRESIPDALISTDAEHRIVSWNTAAEMMYGWKEHEVVGKIAHHVVPATFTGKDDNRENIFSTLLNEGKWRGEVIQHSKDGRPMLVLASVSALRDASGVFCGAVVLNRDITEQKNAENALRESEERLRALFMQAGVGVCVISTDCTIVDVNPKFCEIVDYFREELIHHSCLAMTHPDDRSAHESILEELAGSEKETATFEKRYIRKNGSTTWVRITIAKIWEEKHNVHRYVAIVEDISGKKHAELALRESEATFRILADNIQNLAWMAEPDGRVFWFNQRFYEFTGAAPFQVTGGGWKVLCHPAHAERVTKKIGEFIAQRDPWEITFPIRDANYNFRWFLTRAFPVKDRTGNLLRWIITSTDIDEQKSLSEKLEALVKERTAELQRSNDDLRQFAHVASHDLKEPVRKIKTFLSMFRDQYASALPEEAVGYINRLDHASDRIRSMVDGVLEYSTLNATKKPVDKIDLNQLIDQVQTDLELLISKKSALVTVGWLPRIEGAAALIHQLFYNIMYNSLKFSKSNLPCHIGISSVLLEKDGVDLVKIEITDNGIGFNPEFNEKIFDTFTRLNARDQYEGTGLGLSLCKKIIERHAGTIKARGVPDQGVTITIELPLTQQGATI
jgi:PAS domain S-box-containing protein